MAERKRLTDKLIERLTAPPSGRRDLADELLPALALRITERGTKTWSVVCRTAGQGGETADGCNVGRYRERAVSLPSAPRVSLHPSLRRASSSSYALIMSR
jgi:hypothetical protein